MNQKVLYIASTKKALAKWRTVSRVGDREDIHSGRKLPKARAHRSGGGPHASHAARPIDFEGADSVADLRASTQAGARRKLLKSAQRLTMELPSDLAVADPAASRANQRKTRRRHHGHPGKQQRSSFETNHVW